MLGVKERCGGAGKLLCYMCAKHIKDANLKTVALEECQESEALEWLGM